MGVGSNLEPRTPAKEASLDDDDGAWKAAGVSTKILTVSGDVGLGPLHRKVMTL